MLQGEVKVGDSLEIPALNETRKVKSIQMFRVGATNVSKSNFLMFNFYRISSSLRLQCYKIMLGLLMV